MPPQCYHISHSAVIICYHTGLGYQIYLVFPSAHQVFTICITKKMTKGVQYTKKMSAGVLERR